MKSRNPGEEIKRILRAEVNFGCPVRNADGSGCGSPILTYHHFDPPWVKGLSHEPSGMIALCPEHHGLADGGQWTVSQLRQMKQHPYVDDVVRVQWPWRSETLAMKVGRSLVVGNGSPIRLGNRPIMQFRPQIIPGLGINSVVFDSEIRDRAGRPWLRIVENWFDLRLRGTTDLLFTPQARRFTARHDDFTYIELGFRILNAGDFTKWCATFLGATGAGITSNPESGGLVDSDGKVSVMTIGGHFRTRDVGVDINGDTFVLHTFLPGLRERIDMKSWVVSGENHVSMSLKGRGEFFRLG